MPPDEVLVVVGLADWLEPTDAEDPAALVVVTPAAEEDLTDACWLNFVNAGVLFVAEAAGALVVVVTAAPLAIDEEATDPPGVVLAATPAGPALSVQKSFNRVPYL